MLSEYNVKMDEIRPYTLQDRENLLALSAQAWAPVFSSLQGAVPEFIYECFWPNGWEARQLSDLAKVLDEEPRNIDIAFVGNSPVGWVCTRLHPDDNMGEIYVLVVDPQHQNLGISARLLKHSKERVRDAGMSMVMVETVDDKSHDSAIHLYESKGFERWPVARYFLNLNE